MSSRFLAWGNLINVVRQSSYLTMVAMGQMLALLTGGFDLSVGTIIAITSVVGAMAMTALYTAYPDAVVLSIALGMLAGVGAGVAIGILNGIGVAALGVSPFMMTLGMASIGFGIALFLTGGVPVYGMPQEFGKVLGFGQWLGIPAPIFVTAALIVFLYVLLNWTRLGRYLYAVGGNLKASALSGISTRFTLFMAYVLCGAMTAISGIMLTARLDTGEANIGASMPLESIAACVIGGVSSARRHGPARQCGAGRDLHRPDPERDESGPDRILSADRRRRRAADLRRRRRPDPPAHHGKAARLKETSR